MGITKSIMVVDDDVELREVVSQLLENKGWLVTTAGDGLEALGLVQVTVPSVVLADVEMPNMGGLELRDRLYELPQPPRVVLMSGRRWKADEGKGGTGEDSFLSKPLSGPELLRALERIHTGEEGV